MTKVIKEVAIKPSTSSLGNMAARVVLEDQEDGSVSEGHLFVWDNNKIHFDRSELIGLTVLEAHRLRHAKNTVSERD